MRREDIARYVWAAVGRGVEMDEDPEVTIERFWQNRDRYPSGLPAVAADAGLDGVRAELVELLAWRGRERWATAQKRRAAAAAIAAGCPLRTAAEAADVSPQTIANWASAS